MTSLAAVVRGAGAVNRSWRVWLLIWLLTIAFALVAVLPIAVLLEADLGHSLWAARMFGNFDIAWMAEYFAATGNATFAIAPILIACGVLYLLLSTFFTGGVVSLFAIADGTGTAADFWAGCGRNFWRLLRVLLWSLAAYAIALLAGAGLAAAARKIWGEGMEEHPLVIFGWFRAAFVVLLLLLLNMIFDYARIRVVVEDTRKTARSVLRSCRFVFSNVGLTTSTYGLVLLLSILLAAVYWVLSAALPRNSIGLLLVVLIVQQVYVALRVWVRLLFFAGQTEVYRAMRPAPAAEASAPVVEEPESAAGLVSITPAAAAPEAIASREPAALEPDREPDSPAEERHPEPPAQAAEAPEA